MPKCHLPKPTYEFCSMLEYYNLMQGIYGHYWVGANGAFTCEEIAYGTVSLTSKAPDDSAPKMAAVVCPHRSLQHSRNYGSELKLLEFTVEFEKGTTGAVGWQLCYDSGDETGITHQLNGSWYSGMYLNISERKVFGPKFGSQNKILIENLRIDHTEVATKLVCRRSGGIHNKERKYSIELADGTKVDQVFRDPSPDDGDDPENRVLPVILFSGKVTVSGLKYAINELY